MFMIFLHIRSRNLVVISLQQGVWLLLASFESVPPQTNTPGRPKWHRLPDSISRRSRQSQREPPALNLVEKLTDRFRKVRLEIAALIGEEQDAMTDLRHGM
jgi:hypothetical protein